MVRVTSEVGRLRRVLVHEPGREVDRMVPAMMDELLFDDVLFGDRAREEHAIFRRVLQLSGIEVIEAREALAQTLADPLARSWLLQVLLVDAGPEVRELLTGAEPGALAGMLVEGVRTEAAGSGVDVEDLFRIAPLPNWCFQRDPQVVLGDGVVFCAMAAPARHREALLARALFRFHPELAAAEPIHDPLRPSLDDPLFLARHRPRLEGGDVLVLSPDVVAVGLSERTNETAVLALARALARRENGPRWLVLVEVPKRRAYMHLDTLLTPVDADACLVYPPVILAGGPERAVVAEIDLHDGELNPSPCEGLLPALAARGVDLEPIACGGDDPLRQQREQWTDGANAFALAPGVVTLYDRNVATAEELVRHGFRVIRAEELLLGKEELDLDAAGRTCVLVPSHEISRARGGPHCLTHPLVRDDR